MATFFEKRLAQLERAGIAPAIGECIRAHIEHAEPPGLIQISPYRMADEWKLPRREVLEAFLYGTRIGIFDLRWQLCCPSCKAILALTAHLIWLKSLARCEYCQSEFQAGFDDAVEITFEVNGEVRRTDHRQWLLIDDHVCKINPAGWVEVMKYWNWFETRTSVTVEAQSKWKRQIKIGVGIYYLHSEDFFGLFTPLLVEGEPEQAIQRMDMVFDGEQLTRIDPHVYHPGTLIVQITNTSDRPVQLAFSRRKPYPWVSAAQVASTQTFRDLFASELVSADEIFTIRDVVFVFTDMHGSTSLYKQLGDANAYFLVKEYFKILTQKVQEYNGAVIKKIGDTAMATFLEATDAMNALFASQKAFDEFNLKENLQEKIFIKAGVHRGPCVVVTLNDRLDYFGQTVNLAAMVQRLSTGHEMLLSYSFYQDPIIQALVKKNGWKARHFRAAMGSKEEVYDVVQLSH